MSNETFFKRAFAEILPRPPIWLMRQAGRYLPEYRELRTKAGDFLSLCYNPEWACEVTLQPIRRFGFDAAIIFSDILVVLQALGQKLWFAEGEGPRLGAPDWKPFDENLLQPVYEAISLTRSELAKDKSLIGFAGAPWTLLLYALEGSGGDFANALKTIATGKDGAQKRIDVLTEAVSVHLSNQIDAGCDVVQIFDSWAGLCPDDWQNDFVVKPSQKIVQTVKEKHPDVKIIAFPKGIKDTQSYADTVKPDALGLDQFASLRPMNIAVQGNLDPALLLQGGAKLDEGVDAMLAAMQNRLYIFNLGHGVDKNTPIENVERLVKRVRS